MAEMNWSVENDKTGNSFRVIHGPCSAHAFQQDKDEAEMKSAGRKFDGGKLEYGLLPPLALEETVKVLTFGAQKYERDNWQKVPDSKRRYFDALQRHVWAWKQGEKIDNESGIHHLAHAMCCLMFLYEHDVKYSNNTVDKDLAKQYNENVLL
jgi:hypothetical protein